MFSPIQFLSRVQLCSPMDCSMPGFPVHHQSRSLLKLMSIESKLSDCLSYSKLIMAKQGLETYIWSLLMLLFIILVEGKLIFQGFVYPTGIYDILIK